MDARCVTPVDLYSLLFPNLTRFKSRMKITATELPAFVGWLESHPGLTQLSLTFVDCECLENSWNSLCKCPALTKLHVAFSGQDVFYPSHLPPMLRELTWARNKVNDSLLPDDHQLTSTKLHDFPNNVQRHQTLVGLHTNWLDVYWSSDKSE